MKERRVSRGKDREEGKGIGGSVVRRRTFLREGSEHRRRYRSREREEDIKHRETGKRPDYRTGCVPSASLPRNLTGRGGGKGNKREQKKMRINS